MDLLLIFISIAGVVFAGVMLLLASRTRRMERESDARVHELRAIATGSVLFASDEFASPVDEPIEPAFDLVLEPAVDAPAPPADIATPAHPFVLTVPATAGQGRAFAFARTQRRSRT
jgi:hypothetical protein